jgi:hypothetical protein
MSTTPVLSPPLCWLLPVRMVVTMVFVHGGDYFTTSTLVTV